jgi:hypothetical protein
LIAVAPVLRPSCMPHGPIAPLAVKLIAGRGAGDQRRRPRPGRPGAVDVPWRASGAGPGPGHELTDGGGRRPWIIQRAGPRQAARPRERHGRAGRLRFSSPGRGRTWLPGASAPYPGITLSDAGGQGERTRTRRSGAVQAGWCFTLTPYRTRRSVAATSLLERSRSLSRCLRLVLRCGLARPAAGQHGQQAARLVAVPDRDGARPGVPAAALSMPTCTPARNSPRSAAPMRTRMTASYQSGTGSRGPLGAG